MFIVHRYGLAHRYLYFVRMALLDAPECRVNPTGTTGARKLSLRTKRVVSESSGEHTARCSKRSKGAADRVMSATHASPHLTLRVPRTRRRWHPGANCGRSLQS